MTERSWRSFAVERLRDPSTYRVAAIVGTFINFYGHALVPWLRGHDDVVHVFFSELAANPATVVFSIVLAYVFPVVVGVYSSATTRYRHQRNELRADFPNRKPDPVFRATEDGAIFEAGEATWSLLRDHRIERAQDVVGAEAWREIVKQHRAGATVTRGTSVASETIRRNYLVTHAPSMCGAINVYLTDTGALR